MRNEKDNCEIFRFDILGIAKLDSIFNTKIAIKYTGKIAL
jgi:hypothetical protein